MDFRLSEEQRLLQEMVREFAERQVRPVVAELDARLDPADCYPADLIRKGSELGLRTLVLPEEFGGADAGVLTQAVILQEISKVDPGVAKVFAQCWKITLMIHRVGTDEQRERFLRPFVDDPDCVCSILTTESESGADNHLPYDVPEAGIRLKAEREGDEFVLNGRKQFCSLVGFSKLMIVFARTDRSVGMTQGSTAFVVTDGTPGLSYGRIHDKMGWRLYPQGEAIFENVRVPASHVLGEIDRAWADVRWYFGKTMEIPSCALGAAEAAYEQALEYARDRVQGGKPVIEHQAVGLRLSKMKMLLTTAQIALWHAAWGIDENPDYKPSTTYWAKAFITESCREVAEEAMELMGGSGVMRDTGMEKHVRDILCMFHVDGGRDITLLKAVKHL
jgi:acyl-CoA dehydrogenase